MGERDAATDAAQSETLKTRKTLEGRSATFRVQGEVFFSSFLFLYPGAQKLIFWPQLLHDFLYHFFSKEKMLSRLGRYSLGGLRFFFSFL